MSIKENRPIRIMIVDDHQMFIDGIRLVLKKTKSITLMHEACNGVEALEKLKLGDTDLVVTDISMPEMNGIELIRKIKAEYPKVKVLVLTMFNDLDTILDIIDVEAEGYILKNAGKDELFAAIKKIADNGTYFGNEVIKILSASSNQSKIKNTVELTSREIEILKLICKGLSSGEIADELFISIHTVDTHRKHICRKVKTNTIFGLMRFAVDNGIVKLS